jgi:Cu(I)/Ag(I) efflux system periplasmic protein CusF
MKNTKTLLILAGLLAASASLFAGSHAGAPMTKDAAKKEVAAPMSVSASADMADAEVRKVDKENKKITLKHGVIKSLDMPGMTMVFQVKDAAILDSVKAGDKIKFKAEQAGSAIVVTEIQPAK